MAVVRVRLRLPRQPFQVVVEVVALAARKLSLMPLILARLKAIRLVLLARRALRVEAPRRAAVTARFLPAANSSSLMAAGRGRLDKLATYLLAVVVLGCRARAVTQLMPLGQTRQVVRLERMVEVRAALAALLPRNRI